MIPLNEINEKVVQLHDQELNINSFFDYLVGLDIPQLDKFSRSNYRFVLGSYDGPAQGLCLYEGQIQLFTRFLDDIGLEDEKDLPMQGRLYAIVELTPEERQSLLEYQKAYESCVGYYSTYTNGRRGENYEEVRGECPPHPNIESRNKKVLAWYGESVFDFDSLILRRVGT